MRFKQNENMNYLILHIFYGHIKLFLLIIHFNYLVKYLGEKYKKTLLSTQAVTYSFAHIPQYEF